MTELERWATNEEWIARVIMGSIKSTVDQHKSTRKELNGSIAKRASHTLVGHFKNIIKESLCEPTG